MVCISAIMLFLNLPTIILYMEHLLYCVGIIVRVYVCMCVKQ